MPTSSPFLTTAFALLAIGSCVDLSGRVCMTVEMLRTASNTSQFIECAPLSTEEVEGYKLSDKYLGVWSVRDCPAQHDFDETKQRCEKRSTLRRQQAACSQNPQTTGCSQPCTATNTKAVIGSSCSWQTASLQADTQSNAYFLQCNPANGGDSCGEWVRLPCAQGTVFDRPNSICVPLSVNTNNPCGSSSHPVCSCAAAAVPNPCPGVSSCQKNTCCQSFELSITSALKDQNYGSVMMCPGSNVPPLAGCNEQCPQYSACAPGIGCCPVPVNNNNVPNQNIQISLCPGSFAPPLGSCGSCPQGTNCNPQVNGCCPSSQQPSTDLIYNVVLLCPSGQPPSSQCGPSNSCPNGNGCYQGACCPMQCPTGQTALGFCSSGNCGSGSCYASSGACCQEVVQLPVCANGQTAVQRCSVDAECAANMECSNNGCCPRPYCPSGVQAASRCTGNNGCMGGQGCMEGLCCPLPRCPNGIISLSTCTRTLDCGRPGVECVKGGCCPLPQCPNGIFATQRCTNGGCGNGFSCVQGGCCPLPTCPGGLQAIAACGSNSCSRGFECSNGGCCPLPVCPNGMLSQQRCNNMMGGCGPGMICENGVCCPVPMCSMGSIASSVCGSGNRCQVGYVCEGRGCCPEPLPLCPNGGRASQRCNRGSDCPPGYGCNSLGGCCLLSMEPVCPQAMNAVCQCSPNNACPNGASCTMGTCCASNAVAKFAQVPGTQCSGSSQCNGFTSQCSQCVQQTCICINGAASNGATCKQMAPTVLTLARNGCDQYGSPCRFLLSSARRRPIFAPLTNITETPLFFNVASPRRCIQTEDVDADSTCLPNEKCINGECRMKLWPGEYGCSTDDECTSRCPNTYCETRKSDKNVAQCQCKDGMLLYGRCFSQCPQGFHESGAYCMHDDEDNFWENSDAQDNLKNLLNAGQC